MQGGIISIEDLGSTNGTFVNGEKIQRATLARGRSRADRNQHPQGRRDPVRRVASSHGRAAVAVRRPAPTLQQRTTVGEAPRMTGNLEEIPLPDLLQLFGTSRKNGVLVIRTETLAGRVLLEPGAASPSRRSTTCPSSRRPRPSTACSHGRRGVFELEPPSTREIPEPWNVERAGGPDGRLPAARRAQRDPRQLAAPRPALDAPHSARGTAARARAVASRCTADGAQLAVDRRVVRSHERDGPRRPPRSSRP